MALLFLMLGNLECYDFDQWIEIFCSFPFIGFALMAYPAIATFFEVRRHRDQLQGKLLESKGFQLLVDRSELAGTEADRVVSEANLHSWKVCRNDIPTVA